MSVQVSYRNQFLFGIMYLIVVLVVVEGLVNVWWYQVNACAFEDNVLFEDLNEEEKRQLCLENIEIKYNEMGLVPNQKSQTININSDGFRGPEISKEKQDNTYRIFVVGGSTTFGSGVKDNESAPAHLQKIFDNKELGFNVEVINAGVPGAWSQNEVRYVKEKLIDYDPDLIIVYDGVNDLQHRDKERGVEPWMERWLEICYLGEEIGFDIIITIQPFLGTGNRIPTEQEYPFHAESKAVNRINLYSIFEKQLEKLNNSCSKTADLREIFDDIQETIFFDSSHVNSFANKIVAQNLYEISIPLVQNKALEIISNSNESLKTIDEKDSKTQSLNLGNESFNDIKNILLAYKTPRVLLHLSTVFENNIFEKIIISDQKNIGTNYIMSNKKSCEELGGVWSGVYICVINNLTIYEGDTLQIEPALDVQVRKELVNYGTIILNQGGLIIFQGELINQGGTINVNGIGFLRVVDEGTITNNAGIITIEGLLFNAGEIKNNFDGVITTIFDSNFINTGNVFNNGGKFIFNSGTNIFNIEGELTNNQKGVMIFNMVDMIIGPKFEINNIDGIIIKNGGSITNLGGLIYNEGIFLNNGGDIINKIGEINNQGIFNSTGDIINHCEGIIIETVKILGQISEIPCSDGLIG